MAGARKQQPQAPGTVEKRNRAAHGASTESGLLPKVWHDRRANGREAAFGTSARCKGYTS